MAGSKPKTTAFSSGLTRLVPFLLLTCLSAWCEFSIFLNFTPFTFLASKFVYTDPKVPTTRVAHVIKVLVLSVCWSTTSALCAYIPFKLAFGVPLTGYHALMGYTPLITMWTRPSRDHDYGWLGTGVMCLMFDLPLVVAGYFLREFCGGLRLFSPFATIFDDEIVQGSMPFPSDAATLAQEPYNVCAVVNMCREWPGPQGAYKAHNITQLRLQTQDTCMPSEANLRKGAKFIAEQLERNPGKRVYVHCKGGIARASTMSLAHYILNRSCDPITKIAQMKADRFVVMTEVAQYRTVQALRS